jgi:hypothetical protein
VIDSSELDRNTTDIKTLQNAVIVINTNSLHGVMLPLLDKMQKEDIKEQLDTKKTADPVEDVKTVSVSQSLLRHTLSEIKFGVVEFRGGDRKLRMSYNRKYNSVAVPLMDDDNLYWYLTTCAKKTGRNIIQPQKFRKELLSEFKMSSNDMPMELKIGNMIFEMKVSDRRKIGGEEFVKLKEHFARRLEETRNSYISSLGRLSRAMERELENTLIPPSFLVPSQLLKYDFGMMPMPNDGNSTNNWVGLPAFMVFKLVESNIISETCTIDSVTVIIPEDKRRKYKAVLGVVLKPAGTIAQTIAIDPVPMIHIHMTTAACIDRHRIFRICIGELGNETDGRQYSSMDELNKYIEKVRLTLHHINLNSPLNRTSDFTHFHAMMINAENTGYEGYKKIDGFTVPG